VVLTHSLLVLWTLRKMNENAVDNATHKHTSPIASLTIALIGVRFPNALARKKRGKLSVSMFLYICSFWAWNMSGTAACASASLS
jgi:hypothetical protein